MSNCIPCHEIEGNKFLQSDNRDGVRILSAIAFHTSSTRNCAAVHISSIKISTAAVHSSSTRNSTAAVHLRRADLVHKQFTLFCAHFQEGPALFSPPCHVYISASAFCFYKHYSTSFHSTDLPHILAVPKMLVCWPPAGGKALLPVRSLQRNWWLNGGSLCERNAGRPRLTNVLGPDLTWLLGNCYFVVLQFLVGPMLTLWPLLFRRLWFVGPWLALWQ